MNGKSLDNTYYKTIFLPQRKEYEESLEKQSGGSGVFGGDGDATTSSSVRGIIPTGRDVLLGRGRPFQDHEGNKALAAIIEEHRPLYEEARSTYGKKNIICEDILDIIQTKQRGRFLKQTTLDGNNGCYEWELVSYDIARDKVSHGFRTKKKEKKNQKKSSALAQTQ